MPLQNRVTPFGEIVADAARGSIMGNRGGRLHNPVTRALLGRRWASKQWICCATAFKARRRKVMGRGYTELFFLDEVTALAAGHRPCFECRRTDARRFAACWAAAQRLEAPPKAGIIDHVLHAERLNGRDKRMHTCRLDDLPDGAMIALEGQAFAVYGAWLLPWSASGYGPARARSAAKARLLTPPSSVAVLAQGYSPLFHDSARAGP